MIFFDKVFEEPDHKRTMLSALNINKNFFNLYLQIKGRFFMDPDFVPIQTQEKSPIRIRTKEFGIKLRKEYSCAELDFVK